MVRQIQIEIGNEKAVAVLLEEDAPKTCEGILKALPLKGGAIHAKFAGGEFYIATPIFLELENPTIKQDSGNIAYWPTRQSLCIFYKEVPGLGEVSLFAKVIKNLEGIQREGLKCWIKPSTPVEISEIRTPTGV
ncbi:DUF3830 family protein [Thermoproteota archaeon]